MDNIEVYEYIKTLLSFDIRGHLRDAKLLELESIYSLKESLNGIKWIGKKLGLQTTNGVINTLLEFELAEHNPFMITTLKNIYKYLMYTTDLNNDLKDIWTDGEIENWSILKTHIEASCINMSSFIKKDNADIIRTIDKLDGERDVYVLTRDNIYAVFNDFDYYKGTMSHGRIVKIVDGEILEIKSALYERIDEINWLKLCEYINKDKIICTWV